MEKTAMQKLAQDVRDYVTGQREISPLVIGNRYGPYTPAADLQNIVSNIYSAIGAGFSGLGAGGAGGLIPAGFNDYTPALSAAKSRVVDSLPALTRFFLSGQRQP